MSCSSGSSSEGSENKDLNLLLVVENPELATLNSYFPELNHLNCYLF